MSEAIRLVHLSGAPRERGLQYGRAVGEEVTRYWSELVIDVEEHAERPMKEADLMRWIADRADLSLRAAPDLHEETQGIAEGAEVPYEVALGVIFGEEAHDLASSLGAKRSVHTRCLSLTVPAERTQSENILLAQTWDGPVWNPDPVIVVVEESSGTSVFMTDPSWNGGTGTNTHGLGSIHTGVRISEAPEGMPYPFIARRILQHASIDDAIASVVEYPSTAGCHYIVSDGRRTLDVEAAGMVCATPTHDGLCSTGANFRDPATISQQANPGDAGEMFRASRLLERARDAPRLEPLDVLGLYHDHQEGPNHGDGVCAHTRFRSVGTIVIEPATQTIWANSGNPCEERPIRRVTLVRDGFDTEVIPVATAHQAVDVPNP